MKKVIMISYGEGQPWAASFEVEFPIKMYEVSPDQDPDSGYYFDVMVNDEWVHNSDYPFQDEMEREFAMTACEEALKSAQSAILEGEK